jgi:hypothetical protein
VVEAIERALTTGQPQKLEPLPERPGISIEQARRLPLAKVPEYINTDEPNA